MRLLVIAAACVAGCAGSVDDTGVAGFPEPHDLPVVEAPPDPFVTFWGARPVATPTDWWTLRAPELRALFAHYLYGVAPEAPAVDVQTVATHDGAIELRATYGSAPPLEVLVFLPSGDGPFPVFFGLNKCGNHSVSDLPGVALPTSTFVEDGCDPTEAGRGSRAAYWSIDDALARGFAVATAHQSDLDPDDHDDVAHTDGVHAAIAVDASPDDAWATIAAWAWGVSRAVDVLETVDAIDPDRIAVFGHSRRGKTALWAGANDPRIAMVWAHQSGTGGASLSRSVQGETIGAITTLFPHWFVPRFALFAGEETRLPVDQHLLLALIAPRPLLVTDGDADAWADPEGAQEAVALAAPVWPLLDVDAAPPSWQLRPGEHEVLPEDWATALDFAEARLR